MKTKNAASKGRAEKNLPLDSGFRMSDPYAPSLTASVLVALTCYGFLTPSR